MTETTFYEIVRQHLRYLKPNAPLVPDQDLRSLGLDSMQSVQLLLDLEDAFGVTFLDAYLTPDTFATAGNLWRTITALVDKAGTAAERG